MLFLLLLLNYTITIYLKFSKSRLLFILVRDWRSLRLVLFYFTEFYDHKTFHVKGFFLKSKQEQTENELYYLFNFNLIVENETISGPNRGRICAMTFQQVDGASTHNAIFKEFKVLSPQNKNPPPRWRFCDYHPSCGLTLL